MAGELHFEVGIGCENALNQIKKMEGAIDGMVTQFDKMGKEIETPFEQGKRVLDDYRKSITEVENELNKAKEKQTEYAQIVAETSKAVEDYKQSGKDLNSEEFQNLVRASVDAKLALEQQGEQVDSLSAKKEQMVKTEQRLATSMADAEQRMKSQNAEAQKMEKQRNLYASIDNATGGLISRFVALTKAALAFCATPLGAILAAIVLAFQALQTYLNGTAEGQEKLAKSTGYLNGIMVALKDVVIAIGKSISDFLDLLTSDPLQAVADTWEGVKNYFINWGQQVVALFSNLGEAIWSALKGDFSKAGDLFVEAGGNWLSGFTGKSVEELKSYAKAVSDELEHIADNAEKASKIAARERQLDIDRSKWQIKQAKIDEQLAKERTEFNEGTTKSRLDAAERMMALTREKYAQELKFAEEELALQKANNDLGSNTDADNKITYEKEAKVIQLKAQMNAELATLTKRVAGVRKALIKQAMEDEIAAMVDGSEKEMRQRELQLQEELSQIDDAKERYIEREYAAARDKAKAEALAMNKAWNEIDWESVWRTNIDIQFAAEADATKKRYENQEKLNAEARYGEMRSYAERYKAIQEKSASEIRAAQKAGEGEGVISKLRAQEKQAQQALLAETTDFYNQYISIVQNYQDEIKDINDKVATGEYSADLADALKASSEQNMKSQLAAAGWNEEEITSEMDSITTLLAEATEASLNEVANQYKNVLEQIKETAKETPEYIALQNKAATLQAVIKKRTEKGEPEAQGIRKWKKYQDAISECTAAAKELGDAMGGAMGETLAAVNEVSSLTMQMCSSIVSLVEISTKNIEGVSEAAANAIKTVERASVILAIIGIALQIAQKIASFFKHDDTREKILDEVTKTTEKIEEMKRAMRLDENQNNTIFSTNLWGDLRNNAKQAADNISNVMATANRQFSSPKKWFESIIYNRKDAKLLTKEINSMDDALSLFQDRINSFQIQTKEAKWYKIGSYDKYESLSALGYDFTDANGDFSLDAVKAFTQDGNFKKLSADQQSYINDMIKSWEDYEKALEQLDNNLSSFFSSIGDNLGDAIEQAFLNGTDAAENFKTSVADMLNDMAKKMVVSMHFTSLFEDAQKEMKNVMLKGGDDENVLAEQTRIMTELANNAVAGIDAATSTYGAFIQQLNEAGLTTSSQREEMEAKYGGYETMSEQTGTELSGRFSAMYIVQSEQLSIVTEILSALSESVNLQGDGNAHLSTLVEMHGITNMLLNDVVSSIRENGSASIASLTNIEKYTKSLQ